MIGQCLVGHMFRVYSYIVNYTQFYIHTVLTS